MKLVITIIAAIVVAAGVWFLLPAADDTGRASGETTDKGEQEPLYWVAPMDPNYRRDGPGKSPMGMDLVPVYAEDQAAGTVTIDPAVEQNINVRTAPVERGRLREEIRTFAYVVPDETTIHHVFPRVDGWLTDVAADYRGQAVTRGEPLYSIYSPVLVNAQEEYLAALGKGAASLVEPARRRLMAFDVPAGQIETLATSRSVKRSVTMPAPASGFVMDLAVREGSQVTPGTRILTIAALDPLWVRAEVMSSEVGSIEVGSRMRLRFDDGVTREITADIEFIDPVIDRGSRTVAVRASVPNPDGRLRPNMLAEATILIAAAEPRLLVPRSAVIQVADMNRVVRQTGDGEFRSVVVEVGAMTDTHAEIISGLAAGDRVVTSAQFLIDSESSKTAEFNRMGMGDDGMDHSRMDHSQMNHGEMDHSAMDHSQMDHSQMNHGEMDHSAMDHSQMDHSQMDHGDHEKTEEVSP